MFSFCIQSVVPNFNKFRTSYNALGCQQSDINAVDCYALALSEPTIAAVNFAFVSIKIPHT